MKHAEDIRGRVLDLCDDSYTRPEQASSGDNALRSTARESRLAY